MSVRDLKDDLVSQMASVHLDDAQSPEAQDNSIDVDSDSDLSNNACMQIAGMDDIVDSLREVIGWPVLYSKEASEVGIRWPRGVLLHGPPGVGKTAAVLAVAKEFNASVHLITAGRIMGSYMGESERNLREKFRIAYEEAEASPSIPVVIFLDDVDTLCPRRTHGQHHEARVVGQLLTLLDGADSIRRSPKPPIPQCKVSLNETVSDINATSCVGVAKSNSGSTSSPRGHVMVIAATSRPNSLDPALRRPGRIDKEIAVPMPDVNGRESILRLYIENRLGPMGYRIEDELNEEPREVVSIGQLASESASPKPLGDKSNNNKNINRSTVIRSIAERCHGYTGADLWSLCREAALEATIGSRDNTGKPCNDQVEGPYVITESNFLESMDHVGPSIARSVVSAYQPAYYDDLGGLDEIKLKMQQAIEWPITKAAAFKRFGINVPRGVLLHGPPGCAKTTLARAAITASGATFIPLQGASLYSMYVGEGEAELREAFRRGRLAKPSIIFIDEIDMVVGDRDSHSDDANSSSVRLLSTFLTEMDGMEQEGGVTVVATTNRPDAIDSALIRPGRFDVILYVPPPDFEGRLSIMQIHTRGLPLADDVNLDVLAKLTENYTGAEIEAVCKEAAMTALREDLMGAQEIQQRHFESAIEGIQPLLTSDDIIKYSEWPSQKADI